jgi:hypothetical protein
VTPDAIDTVAERGFMKEERQFGLGVYFMDNATKGEANCCVFCSAFLTLRCAAHIASYRSAPDMKEFTLLIARVTLGDPCILLQVATRCAPPPTPSAHPRTGGFHSQQSPAAPTRRLLFETRRRFALAAGFFSEVL